MRYRTYTSPWRPVTDRNARIREANRGRYPLRTTAWRPTTTAAMKRLAAARSVRGTSAVTRESAADLPING